MVLCFEFTENLLELIKEFSKISGYKIIIKSFISIYFPVNKQLEIEIQKIPLIIASKI